MNQNRKGKKKNEECEYQRREEEKQSAAERENEMNETLFSNSIVKTDYFIFLNDIVFVKRTAYLSICDREYTLYWSRDDIMRWKIKISKPKKKKI